MPSKPITPSKPTSPAKPSVPKKGTDIIEFFWKELFGQSFQTWASLPEKAKSALRDAGVTKILSDADVKKLFEIRHANSKAEFQSFLTKFK